MGEMGTVGLSFGSATSGQGFDVASTVTQIQAASQAIETPWQNQLTALKAQDAVLSTLGTDLSALSTSLQSLTDFEGIFAEKQGSSSNTDVLGLTSASSTAVAGSHSITVSQLAQTASSTSSSISANDTLSGNITINGHNFNIDSVDSDTTLTSLSAAINSADIGVKASVITDSSGSRLSIISGTSGAAGQVTISTNGFSGASSGSITFPAGSSQVGQDAVLSVDGVSITSPSNTVTNAIPGVTFQLLAISTTPVQVEITADTTDIGTAVSSFVSAYNKVIGDINTQEGNSSSGGSSSLAGSSTIAQLQEGLSSSLFGSAASGAISNITQLGITVNNDGTLTLDADTLNSALNSNLTDVTGFLQNANSFGQTLSTTLDNLGTATSHGAIALAQQQNTQQESALNADISSEDALLATQKTQLTDELNAANQILQSIPSQLNEVNSVFDSITGFNPNATQ
jgi:flagellar hook-associated protein 2